jgi:hypothetical protein
VFRNLKARRTGADGLREFGFLAGLGHGLLGGFEQFPHFALEFAYLSPNGGNRRALEVGPHRVVGPV